MSANEVLAVDVPISSESSNLIDNNRTVKRGRRSIVLAMVVAVVVVFCIAIGVAVTTRRTGESGNQGTVGIQTTPKIKSNAKACSSQTVQIDSGGRTRSFELYVPSSATSSSSIIFVWHGINSSPTLIESLVEMKQHADANGWVVVYPVGVGFLSAFNGRGCCDNTPNDVQLAKDIIEYLKTEECANANRVYTTGFSNGGFMGHELGCSEGGLFEAVAVHSGLIGIYNMGSNPLPDWESYEHCSLANGPPLLAIHGTADAVVQYTGGNDPNPFSSAKWYGFLDSVNIWRKRKGCSASDDVTRTEGSTTTCVKNSVCNVEHCTAEGLAHDWSKPALGGGHIDSTSVIIDFFKANGA